MHLKQVFCAFKAGDLNLLTNMWLAKGCAIAAVADMDSTAYYRRAG